MLFAVVQASSPVPRKTDDRPAHAAYNVKDHASSNKSPAAQSQVSVDAPPKKENSRDSVAAENAQRPIKVDELPPVSVTKDWLDKVYIFFTGVLILVGGLGVRAA